MGNSLKSYLFVSVKENVVQVPRSMWNHKHYLFFHAPIHCLRTTVVLVEQIASTLRTTFERT